MAWRPESDDRRAALKRFTDREGLRIAAHDILDMVDVADVGGALTNLAEAALEAVLTALEPTLPFAVVAVGRLGGGELSYASDLDLLFVYDGHTAHDYEAAERTATQLLRFVGGTLPHIYDVDADLRPEGKDGPLARSLEGYATYFERWAQPWERLAMVRARPVAGDLALAARFIDVLEPFVWRDVSNEDRREIRRIKARIEHERLPPDEDPQFHLKLGRGSLSDIEFCTQLLQLEHGVRTPSTATALDQLLEVGALSRSDHDILCDAYRFLERTRNRWFLVNSAPGDALPTRIEELEHLAVSLGATGRELRVEHRRVTRRARAVFERLFYGREAPA
jgi:glutamate-ammonia-ligase adenylyltransferase